MRIALLSPYVWPEVRRGGERYLDDLAWYLRGAGHDVDVITGTALQPGVMATGRGNDVRLKHLRGISHARARMTAVETFGVRVMPTLVRRRYDVVHALSPTAALAAVIARQRTVFTFLGHPTAEWFADHPVKLRVVRAVVRRAPGISALSPPVADNVEQMLGRRPVVIAPGVRTASFSPAARSAMPTILFASAMRAEKGVDVLLRAFAQLAPARPDARLILCGPGDTDWAFEAAGDGVAAVRDRIDVLGPGDPAELPQRYASAHVTVLPSRNEAFGLVLAESLASGTPVVGCRGGGADEIVAAGIGEIVEHGDADALAGAIDRALALAGDAGTAARCLARAELWDWKASIGPQHERLYEDVLRRG